MVSKMYNPSVPAPRATRSAPRAGASTPSKPHIFGQAPEALTSATRSHSPVSRAFACVRRARTALFDHALEVTVVFGQLFKLCHMKFY